MGFREFPGFKGLRIRTTQQKVLCARQCLQIALQVKSSPDELSPVVLQVAKTTAAAEFLDQCEPATERAALKAPSVDCDSGLMLRQSTGFHSDWKPASECLGAFLPPCPASLRAASADSEQAEAGETSDQRPRSSFRPVSTAQPSFSPFEFSCCKDTGADVKYALDARCR